MKGIVTFVLFASLILSNRCFSQNKPLLNNGYWYAENHNKKYYIDDIVVLRNNLPNNAKGCDYIVWNVKRRRINVLKYDACNSLGDVTTYKQKRKLRVVKCGAGKYCLLVKQGFDTLDAFDIDSITSGDATRIKLKRRGTLNEIY